MVDMRRDYFRVFPKVSSQMIMHGLEKLGQDAGGDRQSIIPVGKLEDMLAKLGGVTHAVKANIAQK